MEVTLAVENHVTFIFWILLQIHPALKQPPLLKDSNCFLAYYRELTKMLPVNILPMGSNGQNGFQWIQLQIQDSSC